MWTFEVMVEFVPLPPECEKAYWAAMSYFAEVMFKEYLTAPESELEAVSE